MTPTFTDLIRQLESADAPSFTQIINSLKEPEESGKLVIDGKFAEIDGDEHRIDVAVEYFTQLVKRLAES